MVIFLCSEAVNASENQFAEQQMSTICKNRHFKSDAIPVLKEYNALTPNSSQYYEFLKTRKSVVKASVKVSFNAEAAKTRRFITDF